MMHISFLADSFLLLIFNRLRRRKGREYTYADYWEERWPLHATKAAIKFEGVTYTFSDVEHGTPPPPFLWLITEY